MAYVTIDTSEGAYQIWVEEPVSPSVDPEVPPDPPPPPSPASVDRAPDNVDISAEIRAEVGDGPQVQGYLNLILNKYSAEDLARAYPEFGNERDYQVAKDGLPEGLVVPGTLDAQGRLQAVQGTPEFFQAQQIATQAARDAVRRAAIANGLGGPDSKDVVATTGEGPDGRVFLTTTRGDIDITEYFKGLPQQPVPISIAVQSGATTTVDTGFRKVEILAPTPTNQVVNTDKGTVTFGPDSELAKFIQWQGSQPNPAGPGTIADLWAIQGISNPYSNPTIVGTAVSVIDRTGNREEPWNDKNWPAYQGSTKDAFNSAVNARTNPAEYNKLLAETGWDRATANGWIERILEPEKWAAARAEEDRRNGVVVGGGFVVGPTAVSTTSSNNPSNPTVQTTGTSSTAVNYTALYSQSTSSAAATSAANAQKALDAFLRQNPSNAIRRRSGQAQLTPAQDAANTNNLDKLVAAAVATALAEKAAVVSTTPAGTVAQINSDTSGNSITQTTTVEYTATAGNVSPAIDATIGAQNENVQATLGEVPPITQNAVSTAVAAIPGTIPTTPVTAAQTAGSSSDPLTTIAVIGAAAAGVAVLATFNRTNSNTTANITAGTPTEDNTYVAGEAEDGTWTIYDNKTGEVISSGLDQAAAEQGAENLNTAFNETPITTDIGDDGAAIQEVFKDLATQQAVLQAQTSFVNNGDWRVKLSLAPGADVLYNDTTNQGILLPLFNTGGVIFPYTPQIDTNYRAEYESYVPTHSNYKSHMYKSSYVDTMTLTATFTAQDTAEADYLLAVIHFFRSVTKMFYGQSDANRGVPPPMVFLTGLGEFQFNGHPCVVTNFAYSLPKDVDYIRARSVNVNGTDLLTRRDRQATPSNVISSTITRLKNLFTSQGITKGAEFGYRPTPPTLGGKSPTYVPTKMDITLNLLPIQTRSQVSQLFNLEQYAAGNLLKGGFW